MALRVHIGDSLNDFFTIEVYVGNRRPDGKMEALRFDGDQTIVTVLEEGQRPAGPTFSLRRDIADEFFNEIVKYQLRRGSDPQTEVKVLRESLTHERGRVDSFIDAMIEQLGETQ